MPCFKFVMTNVIAYDITLQLHSHNKKEIKYRWLSRDSLLVHPVRNGTNLSEPAVATNEEGVVLSLEDLPAQAPLRLAEGEAYGKRALEMSAPVLKAHQGLFDQPYGSDYWQKLDVFLPERPSAGPLPILAFAHGGSWIAGYKEWMAFMAPAITAIPAVFVSVSYRLAPENRYPLPFQDCVDAIKWIHDHADDFGGDRSRIYVGGHSAGGHLMALAAMRNDWQQTRNLPKDIIKGCVAVSALFDLRLNTQSSPAESQLYNAFLHTPEDGEAASPVTYISPEAPPFVITIGENDFPFVRKQAADMCKKLEAAGGEVIFQDLEEHDHFDTSKRCIEGGHPWLTEAARLMGGN